MLAGPHITQKGDCSLREGHPYAYGGHKNGRRPLPQRYRLTNSCTPQASQSAMQA